MDYKVMFSTLAWILLDTLWEMELLNHMNHMLELFRFVFHFWETCGVHVCGHVSHECECTCRRVVSMDTWTCEGWNWCQEFSSIALSSDALRQGLSIIELMIWQVLPSAWSRYSLFLPSGARITCRLPHPLSINVDFWRSILRSAVG